MNGWERLEEDNKREGYESRLRQTSSKPRTDSNGFSNYCPVCGSSDYTEGTYSESCNSCGHSVRY